VDATKNSNETKVCSSSHPMNSCWGFSWNARSVLRVLSFLLLLSFFIYSLGLAIYPLLISFGFAYFFFPLLKALESRKIPRQVSVLCVFIVSTLATVGLLALAIPKIADESIQFFQELPALTDRLLIQIEAFAKEYGFQFHYSSKQLSQWILGSLTQVSSEMLQKVTSSLTGFFGSIFQFILVIVNLALIPLFFFYMIGSYEKIIAMIRQWIPIENPQRLQKYIDDLDDVLSGYLRGQLLVGFILGVMYSVGLSWVGVPFGLLIGVLTGLLSIIPYVGALFGFTSSLLLVLANWNGPQPLMGLFVVFAIVQGLEGTVITPRLVGNKVGLPPLVTMLALIIGGNLMGLVGMLFAIPISAFIKRQVLHAYQEN
jgi:predicted PurR-regulated permease PerM